MATKVVATQKARNKQDKDNLYYKIDKQKDEISIDLFLVLVSWISFI